MFNGVIHCFSVDSSTVFDLFWHYKKAAASTVCLTGISCHLIYFIFVLGFILHICYRGFVLGLMELSIIVCVDSSTVFDLFWHYKEAAASTVCLTGIPCHLSYFIFVLEFVLHICDRGFVLGLMELSIVLVWIRPPYLIYFGIIRKLLCRLFVCQAFLATFFVLFLLLGDSTPTLWFLWLAHFLVNFMLGLVLHRS